MSRPLRIEYPGAFYHVTQRGLERREIFREDKDYEKFLKYLLLAHSSYGVNIHTYCLMPNHYHLIVETPEANLKQAMHMINTGYSVYFNKKNNRVGPLFQGRYKSPLIEADEYLDHVSRYIHLNPVKTVTKIAQEPEDYRWSSYRMFIGKEKVPEWLKIEFIIGMFGASEKEAVREYERFVKNAMVDSKKVVDENTMMGILVGGKDFLEEIKGKFIDSKDDAEIPKIREIKRRDDAERFARIKEETGKVIKQEAERKKITIYLARRNTGYKLKEISVLAGGMSYSGISQVCRRLEKRLQEDKKLSAKISKLNEKLSNVKT